ncbi:unnamed protein product [Amoebophrya sp. A25]|nr:unnamed protein product [Amoebophrya sp. A25]|eukprot:GSA25T00021495001.1
MLVLLAHFFLLLRTFFTHHTGISFSSMCHESLHHKFIFLVAFLFLHHFPSMWFVFRWSLSSISVYAFSSLNILRPLSAGFLMSLTLISCVLISLPIFR